MPNESIMLGGCSEGLDKMQKLKWKTVGEPILLYTVLCCIAMRLMKLVNINIPRVYVPYIETTHHLRLQLYLYPKVAWPRIKWVEHNYAIEEPK